MIKKILLSLLLILFARGAFAQEFLCNVQIQFQQVAGVDPSVFDAMEKSIFEFMNNRKWSQFNMGVQERIECTMIFTIENARQGGDEFAAKLNLVLQRPIFGTDYNSVVINLVDDNVNFKYVPYQSMDYSDNAFNDNLTQILAYYAYLMLGLDFDTYSLEGGTQFYEKAMAVVQTAQSSNFKGWQAFEGPKTRYGLVENLLNTSYNNIRKVLYEYHRKGLDVMAENMENGRTVITNSLGDLKSVYDKRPNLYLFQVVLEAKRQEIINVYQEASPSEKVAMINIMSEVDPPNGNKYEAVNK